MKIALVRNYHLVQINLQCIIDANMVAYCNFIFIVLCLFVQVSSEENEMTSILSSWSRPSKSLEKVTFPYSSQVPPKSSIKLKICSNASLSGDINFVKIPTFLTNDLEYLLADHEIDWENPLESCYNGAPPNREVTVVQQTDYYQRKRSSRSVFTILRKISLLMENGYLSVGDATTMTAKFYSTEEFCLSGANGSERFASATFRLCPFSSKRPVLPKCCPLGMMYGEKGCIKYTTNESWDPVYMDPETGSFRSLHLVNPVYELYQYSLRKRCPPNTLYKWVADNCHLEFHPVTDNRIAFLGEYRTWKFLNVTGHWCTDLRAKFTKDGGRVESMLYYCQKDSTIKIDLQSKPEYTQGDVYMICMYVGAIFHFLTTLVHLVTWKWQNIHGQTLCSCTTSLFLMQVFLGTVHLLGIVEVESGSLVCIVNGIMAQYFFIASFTWLMVLNFDLWRTLRRIRTKNEPGFKRFLGYSAFGWGFPLMVSIVSICLNFRYKCRVSRVLIPDFGQETCFIARWAQGPYLYYILSVLVVFVMIFATLTMLSIYRLKQGTGRLRSIQSGYDKQNVLLILKLTVVMGISWTFEVLSWASSTEKETQRAWIFFDLYNCLSAILIFVIFVCTRSQLLLLEQSIPALSRLTRKLCPFTKPEAGNTSSFTTLTLSRKNTRVSLSGIIKSNEYINLPDLRGMRKDNVEEDNVL